MCVGGEWKNAYKRKMGVAKNVKTEQYKVKTIKKSYKEMAN